jgi:mono/diheme cytochrome c family protein
MTMIKTAAAFACLLVWAGGALAGPFDKGDPKAGKQVADKACIACHASMFGGDGSKIFTRPDHKIQNPQQLLARVQACNSTTGAGLNAQQELDVAAYLNQQFYKFK